MTGITFNPTLRFLSDPGHGWLSVPRRLINELGIAAEISGYSYQSGDRVYLEEDCDAPLLVAAMKARNVEPRIVRCEQCFGNSFIRRLPRFSA